MRVAGLLLAAGAGRRLGRPKALLRLGNRTLVAHVAQVLAEGGCDPVYVVAGAAPLDLPNVVVNPDWAGGMGSSLAAGLRAIEDAQAVVVALVDQPGVTPAAVRRLVERAGPEALAAAAYDGRRGHPVLFGQSHWAGIIAHAKGDVGAREYLRDRDIGLVECGDVASDDDIDTPEAAQAWGIEWGSG